MFFLQNRGRSAGLYPLRVKLCEKERMAGMEYRALGNSNLDDGTVKGDRREAACMAWFPASRELYPVSVKFRGDDGEVICVRNINISSSEDILCNGIASKQFLCNAVIGGLVQDFALIFYARPSRWEIVFRPRQ
jgi:hypothetical protein